MVDITDPCDDIIEPTGSNNNPPDTGTPPEPPAPVEPPFDPGFLTPDDVIRKVLVTADREINIIPLQYFIGSRNQAQAYKDSVATSDIASILSVQNITQGQFNPGFLLNPQTSLGEYFNTAGQGDEGGAPWRDDYRGFRHRAGFLSENLYQNYPNPSQPIANSDVAGSVEQSRFYGMTDPVRLLTYSLWYHEQQGLREEDELSRNTQENSQGLETSDPLLMQPAFMHDLFPFGDPSRPDQNIAPLRFTSKQYNTPTMQDGQISPNRDVRGGFTEFCNLDVTANASDLLFLVNVDGDDDNADEDVDGVHRFSYHRSFHRMANSFAAKLRNQLMRPFGHLHKDQEDIVNNIYEHVHVQGAFEQYRLLANNKPQGFPNSEGDDILAVARNIPLTGPTAPRLVDNDITRIVDEDELLKLRARLDLQNSGIPDNKYPIKVFEDYTFSAKQPFYPKELDNLQLSRFISADFETYVGRYIEYPDTMKETDKISLYRLYTSKMSQDTDLFGGTVSDLEKSLQGTAKPDENILCGPSTTIQKFTCSAIKEMKEANKQLADSFDHYIKLTINTNQSSLMAEMLEEYDMDKYALELCTHDKVRRPDLDPSDISLGEDDKFGAAGLEGRNDDFPMQVVQILDEALTRTPEDAINISDIFGTQSAGLNQSEILGDPNDKRLKTIVRHHEGFLDKIRDLSIRNVDWFAGYTESGTAEQRGIKKTEYPIPFNRGEVANNSLLKFVDTMKSKMFLNEYHAKYMDASARDKNRSYQEILEGKKAHSEIIGYRVTKHEVEEIPKTRVVGETCTTTVSEEDFNNGGTIRIGGNSGNCEDIVVETLEYRVNPKPIQEFLFSDSNSVDTIEFIDTQVLPGKKYAYRVQTINFVLGSKYFYAAVTHGASAATNSFNNGGLVSINQRLGLTSPNRGRSFDLLHPNMRLPRDANGNVTPTKVDSVAPTGLLYSFDNGSTFKSEGIDKDNRPGVTQSEFTQFLDKPRDIGGGPDDPTFLTQYRSAYESVRLKFPVGLLVRTLSVPKLIEAPFIDKIISLRDHPPIKPEVNFLPSKGKSDKMNILLIQGRGTSEEVPVNIDYAGDHSTFFATAEAQGHKITPNKGLKEFPPLHFSSDTPPEYFEIFRNENPPSSYFDFKFPDMFKRIPANGGTLYYVDDNFEPNKNYYYTFRAKDSAGLSNPTQVFRVKMVDYQSGIFMDMEPYEFPTFQKQYSIDFTRALQICPSFRYKSLHVSGEDINSRSFYTNAPDNNILDLGAPGNVGPWAKTYKLRITSKTSGRKINIKFKFEKEKVILEKQTNTGNPRIQESEAPCHDGGEIV